MALLKCFLMSLAFGCGAAGVAFFYSKSYGDKTIGNRRQHEMVDKINHMGAYSVTNVTVKEDVSVMGTSHLS